MSFHLKAYADDHAISVTMTTAQEAFAKAIEWRVVQKFNDVAIIEGNKRYSIEEFAELLAVNGLNTKPVVRPTS